MNWTREQRYRSFSGMTKEEYEKLQQTVEQSPWRQTFHIQPPIGLLNDPNGFCFHSGQYHLFYQWFPFGPVHGLKHWYHVTSDDLVHWENQGVGMEPQKWFESHGAYSGSGIVHDDKLHLLYTGNTRDSEWKRHSYQCIAIMDKHGDIKKHTAPIIQGPPEGYTQHFRDPKVWQQGDSFYLVIGAQRENQTGCVLLYRSSNTFQWEFVGEVKTGKNDFGFMWECPDYFELDGKGVLLFSPQGLEAQNYHYQNIYQSGFLIGTPIHLDDGFFEHGEFQELDAGFDFYAQQTTLAPDGRRILIGWMGLPEIEYPTDRHQWAHCLTIPRELFIKNGSLYQQPVREMEKLRRSHTAKFDTINNESKTYDSIYGQCYELKSEINIQTAATCGIKLRTGQEEETVLYYDNDKKEIVLDRGKSGERFAEAYGFTRSKPLDVEALSLHIFVDVSSVEIFVNEGAYVFTARIFPSRDSRGIAFFARNGRIDLQVDHWSYEQHEAIRKVK
ncbi:sucrose-6-phosphate hydrolase [Salicibibacter halophilus]|uniref:Sucrose-6-phosphate hydrolase n=1 Tax=Salicibibacter halophilus TaxID=2502791 RepID=A0A514LIS3_9BACI|nr:sucrose-6-phosphate hydrolase [Salicibibacter halophilus]QDI91425.1 sucrose-6-phosphate hydrolase [Salicibibacter halophilus]